MTEEKNTKKDKKAVKREARPQSPKEYLRHLIEAAEEIKLPEEPTAECPEFAKLPALDRKLYKVKYNDAGNTERLITRYGKNLIYVERSGWYSWNKKNWSREEGSKNAYLFAENTAEGIMGEAVAAMCAGMREGETSKKFTERIKAYYKFAVNSGNYNRMTAMVKHAENHLWEKAEVFDTHPFLITVSNGTLVMNAEDNGEESFDGMVLNKFDREHKITKIANVKYDPSATAETFQTFIHDIMPDDEIRLFLQRFFGYCLTGDISEQVIVMFWGQGSNGKSTLVDLVDWILGDYAMITPFQSLLHSHKKSGGDATPDLARLPAARFVSAAEPDINARLSEAMIKQMTGEEKMSVRHLQKDFFDFLPQFKLCLSFNNKPKIKGTDEGIWRRLLLVPFDQRFVDEELVSQRPGAKAKIKGLNKKLREEAPGIFNWMLDGYRMWAESGLAVPEKIRALTEEYRHEQNPVLPFVQGWCEKAPGVKTQASTLFDAYELWCKENAETPENNTNWGLSMAAMRLEKITSGCVFYLNLKLTDEAETRLYESRRNHWKNKEFNDDDE
ncbi:MAG: hypothetical protein H6867_04885 [Rhodospirillales bacterium]|nr:hypothetical protein [Rhodospirillales bacterium]MCB9994836.1 hypothetical protein [Rhodospirillales bacterium]